MYTHHNIDFPNISYGFFSRQGGVSEGMYKGLNCGIGSNDDQKNVKENRRRVAEKIGTSPENLIGAYQVHGNKVLVVDKPLEERPKVDAIVTTTPNLALSVLTADCAPILFFSGDVIGAAHAGWKGALAGIIDNTINEMTKLGATNITACIGPCIAQSSYEVSKDFKSNFLDDNARNEIFFSKDNHFDLSGYCEYRIKQCEVETVHIIKQDTYKLKDQFFSFRRTTHRFESDYGRQISAIMLKS